MPSISDQHRDEWKEQTLWELWNFTTETLPATLAHRDALISEARWLGVSWQDIARGLEITPQGAWKTYRYLPKKRRPRGTGYR